MVRLLLGLSLLLSACCAPAPLTETSAPTAFVARVVALGPDYVSAMTEGRPGTLTLEVADLILPPLTVGSRLYVQGELSPDGRVRVSSLQALDD